ncbi:hypothetical protein BU17DRAFT_72018 [Hysterangium stoloniferum]|nr:hypothetical protein BU17DRAFT_72018 [Hysterangium stoloniferum]
MTDHHAMDVDIPSSGGLSASSSSSSMAGLAGVDLDALNFCQLVKVNDKDRLLLSSQALEYLLLEVAKTKFKGSVIAAPGFQERGDILRSFNTKEAEQWNAGMRKGVEKDDWRNLITHHTYILDYRKSLQSSKTDDEVRTNKEIIYAKAIPVVQSSGTGKSRMLTEAGAAGYPPSDLEVVKYFAAFTKDNDLSLTAHDAIACFLAAAHKIMLDWLQTAKRHHQFDGPQLLGTGMSLWNHRERGTAGTDFLRNLLNKQILQVVIFFSWRHALGHRRVTREPSNPDPHDFSTIFYEPIAKKATEDLMAFLSTIQSPQALSVTYFDEAHELGLCFWVLLHLLQGSIFGLLKGLILANWGASVIRIDRSDQAAYCDVLARDKRSLAMENVHGNKAKDARWDLKEWRIGESIAKATHEVKHFFLL